MDGTGVAESWDLGRVEFTFDANGGFFMEASDAAIESLAHDIFWDKVNRQLDDPVIDASELEGAPVEFVSGSKAELERATTVALHALEVWQGSDERRVSYPSNTDEGPLGCSWANGWMDENTSELLEVVAGENEFTGSNWEYNDGRPTARAGTASARRRSW